MLPLEDFLWQLIRGTGYYAYVGALPEGEQRQANLRLFCQLAADYSRDNADGLRGFLERTEQ